MGLARGQGRSGDAATISGYLGNSDTVDQAIAAFAYADQTERDHAVLKKAASSGRINVREEEV